MGEDQRPDALVGSDGRTNNRFIPDRAKNKLRVLGLRLEARRCDRSGLLSGANSQPHQDRHRPADGVE